MKRKIEKMIEEAKREYFEKGKKKAIEDKNSGAYYKLANNLKDGEAPKPFDLRDIKPHLSAFELANDVAEFFNVITRDYPPLPKRTSWADENVTPLELYQVAARIKSFKKPRSMIRGDIFPDLVSKFSDILAIPLTDIFNKALASKQWPDSWKEETMIIIPKCTNPQSYSELRKVSCTPLFSKILESFVLETLHKEILPSMIAQKGQEPNTT